MSYIRIILDIQNQHVARLFPNYEIKDASYESTSSIGDLFDFTLQNQTRVREMHGMPCPTGPLRPRAIRVRASAQALAYPLPRADWPIYPQAWRHAGLSHVTLDNRVDKPEQVRKGCAKSLFFLQLQQTDHFLSSCAPCFEPANSACLCVFCAITAMALHRVHASGAPCRSAPWPAGAACESTRNGPSKRARAHTGTRHASRQERRGAPKP